MEERMLSTLNALTDGEGSCCKMKTETMEGYLKDSNVGVDLVVGGAVTPTDTANHELAAQALLKLRTAFLIVIAAYQFEEAKGSWEMNETNTTEDAIPIPTSEDVNSRYLTMSSGPELSESGAVGEGLYNSNPSGIFTLGIDSRDENDEVDEQHDEIRATPSEWILLLTSLIIEILSAVFDQASSPSKPHYALIGMLLAIGAVLVCIWELVHNGKKERIVLRRRGILWCFYYPPPNNMLFGTFAEITGLCLATAQCICSAVQYHFIRRHATNPMKLSPLAAVFFLGLVVSKLVQNHRFTVDDTLQNGT